MKRSLFGIFMYLFCAVTGVLLGYGIVTFTSAKENIENTKDNTLVREAGDSVFFIEQTVDSSEEFLSEQVSVISEPPFITQTPDLSDVTLSQNISVSILPSSTQTKASSENIVAPTLVPNAAATSTAASEPSVLPITPIPSAEEKNTDSSEQKLPSLGMQWISKDKTVPQPVLPIAAPKLQETQTAEVITYPMQIFGQVPIINRSDEYVSYFEFSYDLIAILEPVAEARGFNMNSLLAKFVIKALLCGVDIEKLDINAPIPRRLSALCLWLTAQILNESDVNASYKRAESYVTDIAGCSASEKKAIAYLYESGILNSSQISDQRFYPAEGLKTEDGNAWLAVIKQYWK